MSRRDKQISQISETVDREILHALRAGKNTAEAFLSLIESNSHKIVVEVLLKKIPEWEIPEICALAENAAAIRPVKKTLRCLKLLAPCTSSDHVTHFLLQLFLSSSSPEISSVVQKHFALVLEPQQIEVLICLVQDDFTVSPKPLLSLPDSLLTLLSSWLSQKIGDFHREERMHIVKLLGIFARKTPEAIPHLMKSLNDKSTKVCTRAALFVSGCAPESIPYLREILESPDSRTRIVSLWTLGKVKENTQTVLPDVIRQLEDENEKVRETATETLILWGKNVIPPLLEKLPHMASSAAVVAGIKVLECLGESSAEISACLNALGDREAPEIRIAVLETLQKIALPEISPLIEKRLDDAVPEVRLAALQVLEKQPVSSGSFSEKIVSLVKSEESPQMRRAGVMALSRAGRDERQVFDFMIELLEDESPPVQMAAVKSIGLWGQEAKSAVPRLIDFVQSDKRGLQLASLEAIARINPPAKEVVPVISRLISWDNPLLTSQVILTLGALGPGTYPGLLEIAAKAPTEYQKYFIEALLQKGVQSIPFLMEKFVGECSQQRKLAALALTKMGKPAILPLIKILHRKDFWVRKAASRALRQIGQDAVEPLLDVIRDEHSNARESAYQILRGMKGQSLPALICVMQDPAPQVSQFALQIFHKINPDYHEAVPGLISLLGHSHPMIRQAALWSLGKIGNRSREVLEALARSSRDPVPEVRKVCEETIRELQKQKT